MTTTTLVASTPTEMQLSQNALISWMDKKIERQLALTAELEENLAIARKNKWRTKTLERHARIAGKKVEFYRKIKMALEAGYHIIPSMPFDFFAIRTDRSKPLPKGTTTKWDSHQQQAQTLAAGEGGYVSDVPFKAITDEKTEKNHKGEIVTRDWWEATEWDDVEFPFQLAKPQILEATGRAMALKIFDRIGVLPSRPKKDPIVAGEILDPSSPNGGVTFLITWFLDVDSI